MSEIIYLNVEFKEKDEAKSLGARWDSNAKKWYISANENLKLFMKWLPEAHHILVKDTKPFSDKAKQHLTIREIKSQIQQAIKAKFPKDFWLVGEVIKLTTKNGHLYIDLQDDEALQANGQVFSLSVKAWGEKASFIQNKLKTEAGLELAENQRVRLKVKLDFHAQYDLSGSVSDIDPELTMGQIAQLQRQIKEKFIAEKIFDKNKHLAKPKDFCRVIVIHPDNASGFHDFKSTADKLKGLCDFIYFQSKFEGQHVEKQMQKALVEAKRLHLENPVDALIIIRGGGARQGLLTLSQESILRHIVLFPAPVILGVGHTDDKLLFDEIVNISCGTPSKVIEFITSTISNNVNQAKNDINSVIYLSHRVLSDWNKKIKDNISTVQSLAIKECHNKRQVIEQAWQSLSKDSSYSIQELLKTSANLADFLYQNSQDQFKRIKQQTQWAGEVLITSSKSTIFGYKKDIKGMIGNVICDGQSAIENYRASIADSFSELEQAVLFQSKRISEKLSSSFEAIQSLSPEKTLKRGYSLAIGKMGVIKTVYAAKQEKEFTMRFCEGKCRVTYKEEIK